MDTNPRSSVSQHLRTPEDTREALVKRLREQGHSLMSLGTRRANVVPQAEAKIHQLASLLFEAAEELDVASRLAAPVGEQELCRLCKGNGVIKIPGGVSVCPRCNQDCYEPISAPMSGEDTREALVAAVSNFLQCWREMPHSFKDALDGILDAPVQRLWDALPNGEAADHLAAPVGEQEQAMPPIEVGDWVLTKAANYMLESALADAAAPRPVETDCTCAPGMRERGVGCPACLARSDAALTPPPPTEAHEDETETLAADYLAWTKGERAALRAQVQALTASNKAMHESIMAAEEVLEEQGRREGEWLATGIAAIVGERDAIRQATTAALIAAVEQLPRVTAVIRGLEIDRASGPYAEICDRSDGPLLRRDQVLTALRTAPPP